MLLLSYAIFLLQYVAPQIAKLVHTCNYYGLSIHDYSFHGVYKPSDNVSGPHIVVNDPPLNPWFRDVPSSCS